MGNVKAKLTEYRNRCNMKTKEQSKMVDPCSQPFLWRWAKMAQDDDNVYTISARSPKVVKKFSHISL